MLCVTNLSVPNIILEQKWSQAHREGNHVTWNSIWKRQKVLPYASRLHWEIDQGDLPSTANLTEAQDPFEPRRGMAWSKTALIRLYALVNLLAMPKDAAENCDVAVAAADRWEPRHQVVVTSLEVVHRWPEGEEETAGQVVADAELHILDYHGWVETRSSNEERRSDLDGFGTVALKHGRAWTGGEGWEQDEEEDGQRERVETGEVVIAG